MDHVPPRAPKRPDPDSLTRVPPNPISLLFVPVCAATTTATLWGLTVGWSLGIVVELAVCLAFAGVLVALLAGTREKKRTVGRVEKPQLPWWGDEQASLEAERKAGLVFDEHDGLLDGYYQLVTCRLEVTGPDGTAPPPTLMEIEERVWEGRDTTGEPNGLYAMPDGTPLEVPVSVGWALERMRLKAVNSFGLPSPVFSVRDVDPLRDAGVPLKSIADSVDQIKREVEEAHERVRQLRRWWR